MLHFILLYGLPEIRWSSIYSITYSKQYGNRMKVVSLTYHCMYFKVAMILHIFMYNCISSSLTKYWFDFRQKMDRHFFNITEIQRWDYNLGLTHKWYLNIFYTKLGIKILLPMISPTTSEHTLLQITVFRFAISFCHPSFLIRGRQ